ncbi:hypothetical protein SteCoe_28445 [Stentor coeruleus]|uniref:BTB domain-containing protein n=1 Tax=Stentor coeruleus TaxID=5963 RepID=A0A1R2B894_9CILI|nr:hypothetical protein SteCoe_28445 [Stentor coeruleus]
MSLNSLDTSLQILTKSLEELKDEEIASRAALDLIRDLNQARKSAGFLPLCIDENCVLAACESFQTLGSFQSLLTTFDVVGSDFISISQEKTLEINSSHSPNPGIYNCFKNLFNSIDQGQKDQVLNPSFTHIGLAFKRSFGSFKVIAILFKKPIMIHHCSFDANSGVYVSGCMLDPISCMYVAVFKDGKEAVKSVIAGPKRINADRNNKTFEVNIPRMLMSSRSNNEKYMEFYILKNDSGSISYGTGQDLNALPSEGVLAHKMTFLGIYESNVMIESRTLEESFKIKQEYENKVGSKLITHSSAARGTTVGIGRGRGTTRGLGSSGITGSTGLGSGTNTSTRADWGTRSTPWKPPVSRPLSIISEVPREGEKSAEAWARDPNKENFSSFKDQSVRDTQLGYNFSQSLNDTIMNPSPNFNKSNFNSTFTNPHNSNNFTNANPSVPNPFAMPSSTQMLSSNISQGPSPSSFSNQPSNYANQSTNYPNNSNSVFPSSGQGIYPGQGSMHQNGPSNNYPNQVSAPSFQSNFSQQRTYVNGSFQNPYPGMFNQPSPSSNFINTGAYPNQSFPTSMNLPINYSQCLSQNNIGSFPIQNSYFPSGLLPNFITQGTSPINPLTNQNFLQPALNSLNLGRDPIAMTSFQGKNSFPFIVSQKAPDYKHFTLQDPDKTEEDYKLKTKLESSSSQTTDKFYGIDIPNLILPMPASLLQEISKPRPENSSYTKLYTTMEYHDVILKVKDTEFKAHKAVLFSASGFFREKLEQTRSMSQFQITKLLLPNWFILDPFKTVMKFMYTFNLDKESINIKFARDILAIADFLQMQDLCDIIIIKHIIPQLSKEEVLGLLKQSSSREKEATPGWDYLFESCLVYAGQHSSFLARNMRSECLSLPLPCVIKLVDSSMKYINNSEQTSLVIKLLTDLRYASCVFELTNKVTELFISGYMDYPVDIRKLDGVRPLTTAQLAKLEENITMEYPLIDEKAPFYNEAVRENSIPPVKSQYPINQMDLCGKTIPIINQKDMIARTKRPFCFKVTDIFRPKNVMSPVFISESHKWSVLVSTSIDGMISVFLCDRGICKKNSHFTPLLFTTVVFEIEMDDKGVKDSLRTSNQPGYTAGFYSFPNGQFHIIGERNFCKISSLKSIESVSFNLYIRELNIHSGLLHYLCENFDTLMSKNPEKFVDIGGFNLKYLLSHDLLPVSDEREAAGALWRYSANKPQDMINMLVFEIRYQYLTTIDLLTIARDHAGIRSSPNFKYIFRIEFQRRVENKGRNEKPRKKYENKAKENYIKEYGDEIVNWILESNHHQGYEERINELKKKLEEQKNETNRTKAEIHAKKIELNQEWEKLSKQINYISQPYQPPEARPQENEVFYTPDKNCIIF